MSDPRSYRRNPGDPIDNPEKYGFSSDNIPHSPYVDVPIQTKAKGDHNLLSITEQIEVNLQELMLKSEPVLKTVEPRGVVEDHMIEGSLLRRLISINEIIKDFNSRIQV